jgi:hypothetical protein
VKRDERASGHVDDLLQPAIAIGARKGREQGLMSAPPIVAKLPLESRGAETAC